MDKVGAVSGGVGLAGAGGGGRICLWTRINK